MKLVKGKVHTYENSLTVKTPYMFSGLDQKRMPLDNKLDSFSIPTYVVRTLLY